MNYTTLAKVKAALGAAETTDDSLLQVKIEEASRILDATICHAPADFFKAETIAAAVIMGRVDIEGNVLCWPGKAVVTAVTAFSYRFNPVQDWVVVDPAHVAIEAGREVKAYSAANIRGRCQVRLTYTGGYGTETWAGAPSVATITGLPADLIDAATVLAVRLYKEEKGGLTDAIGVAELGTMTYTKAMPQRVVKIGEVYGRKVV